MVPNAETLARAHAYHRAGQLRDAERHYRQALALDAANHELHHQLGNLLAEQNNFQEATLCYRKALELAPDFLPALGNLGHVLKHQGKLDEAAACYARILELHPTAAMAHNDLGLVAQLQGAFDVAVGHYRQAIRLQADFAEAHSNLGTALARQGKLAEAVESYVRALELRPDFEDVHSNLGAALARLGRLDEAVASCRRALQLKPDYVEARCNLGFAWMQQGNFEEAAACYRAAVALRPDLAEAHHNLALVLVHAGNLAEAVAAGGRAVELKPEYPQACNTLAIALARQGKLAEAVNWFRRALQLKPDDADAYNNLAHAELARHQFDAAEASCRRALQLRPDFAEAYSTLAAALAGQGKPREAADCCRRALESKPDCAEAHNNLGAIAEKLGNPSEAIVHCRRAIELKPDFAEAHNNLGAIWQQQGDLKRAADCCRRAIELKPRFAEAHNNLGAILDKLEDPQAAADCCRRALEIVPDFPDASNNLGSILARQDRIDQARQCYADALALRPEQDVWRLSLASLCPAVFPSNEAIAQYRGQLLADLEGFARRGLSLDPALLHGSACRPSFELPYHGHDDRPIREAYSRILRDCFPSETAAGTTGRPRVGFVVTDRHENVFIRCLGGILDRLDSQSFEPIVIGSQQGAARLRAGIGSPAVQVVAVPEQFDRMVEAIRAMSLDLLYHWEIATDNSNYFLPFVRLAPVQCTSWGIQVTSGIPQVDHYLSSALVEPEDAAEHYTENLVLANTLLTYQRRQRLPDAPVQREDFGFAPRQHVYLYAQMLSKLQPDFDPILAGILRRDGQGVVVVVEDKRRPSMGEQLRRRFAAGMPDVADRVVFLPFQSTGGYFSLLAAADVLLDPVHFGGVNSSYDGFSLGKPIVTLPSRFQRGRYTLGCYRKMGMMDCVARDAEHYVDISVALGTDADYRAAIERKIDQTSPALFEDAEAVREHERIFSLLIEQARGHRTARNS